MTTTYSMFAFTKSTLEQFVVYQVNINDKDKLLETLTPDEIAMAKIIRYIYEKHSGYPLNFTLYNESNGAMGCPGIFGGIGGPTEVPSPEYMTIEKATEEYNHFVKLYNEDYIPYYSPEQIMNEHNCLEDQLIKSIKYRKDTRKNLLNKIINIWNVPTDGVRVRHGIDKFDENSLC